MQMMEVMKIESAQRVRLELLEVEIHGYCRRPVPSELRRENACLRNISVRNTFRSQGVSRLKSQDVNSHNALNRDSHAFLHSLEMNVSSTNVSLASRDSLALAVTKNVMVVVLGFTISYVNATFVYTFCKHQVFNTSPRYILFIHLVLNDMLQVSLSIVLFLISYTIYRINVSFCCTLVLLALFTTENTPLNLACMAVECCIAICLPLRHVRICTVRRTLVLISLIWVTSLLSILPDLFLTLATQPAAFFSTSVFCLRTTVFPHPLIIVKRDVTYSLLLVIVWVTLFYSYLMILFTAKSASKDTRKARNTILLHGFQLLLCMTTYAAPQLSKIMQLWFPRHSSHILFCVYIVVYILPRSISPIIYGVRDKTFRRHLVGHLLCWIK
ncbi:odorant receptor 131-2-like [Neosynchiropus ocellatus]